MVHSSPTKSAQQLQKFRQEVSSKLSALPFGSVIVFGSGDCGQLGMGEDFVSCPRPKRHPFFESREIVAVAAGGLHTLALSRTGRVYSWGCNDEKALGHSAEEFTVSQVHCLDEEFIVQVTCGDSISAALSAEGKIYTWGTFRDSKGVIGVKSKKFGSEGHSDFHIVPTLLKDLSHLRIKKISAGANHLLALSEDGEVYAWGCGEQGQLGRRVLERHKKLALHPTRITPRRHRNHGGIISMICGSYHSFLLAGDGTVFAVGLNNFGQLGLGDFEDRLVPEEIPVEAWQGHKIIDLAAGEHHSMALSASGTVFVFGRSDFHQMGLPDSSEDVRAHNTPVLNPALPTPISQIAAGSNHNLAISSDRHQIFSWGYGEMGQLGHDDESDEKVPRKIEAFSAVTKFLDISAGGQHSIILMTKPQ